MSGVQGGSSLSLTFSFLFYYRVLNSIPLIPLKVRGNRIKKVGGKWGQLVRGANQ